MQSFQNKNLSSRNNHTNNIPEVWEKRLADYVNRTGVRIISRPRRLTKKSRIITSCSHGISDRSCQILNSLQHCCRKASKLGQNNPSYGLPAWNSGTVGISLGHGFGANPSEKERILPGILYLIRYLDEAGTHFKIGITKRSIQKRFKNNQLVSIIHLHHSTLGECFDLEQKILNWARRNKYRYSSPTTTELIKPEAYSIVLEWLRNVETFTPPGR